MTKKDAQTIISEVEASIGRDTDQTCKDMIKGMISKARGLIVGIKGHEDISAEAERVIEELRVAI